MDNLEFLDKKVITDIRFSPSGELIAVSSIIGVALLDAKTLELKYFVPSKYGFRDGYGIPIATADFSPDGELLAFSDYGVYVLNVRTKERVASFKGDVKVRFDDSGELLLCWEDDEPSVSVWDLKAQKRIGMCATIGPSFVEGAVDDIMVVGVTGDIGNRLEIWDLKSFELIRRMRGRLRRGKLSISSDRRSIAVAGVEEGDDRIKVKIFDVKTWELLYDVKLPCRLSGRRWVESLAFNRDHIVVSTGKYIYFWDVNEEKMISKEGEGYFRFLSFNPVEPRLVSWSEGNLILWDMSTYSPIRIISAPKGKQ